MKRYKKKKSSLLHSFRYAFSGVRHALSSQRNMKIHSLALMIAVTLGVLTKISRIEWMIICLVSAMVISLEMINTSVELVVDLSTKEQRLRAKLAKDVAAGAVLISSILALLCAYLIFYPRLVTLSSGGL